MIMNNHKKPSFLSYVEKKENPKLKQCHLLILSTDISK